MIRSTTVVVVALGLALAGCGGEDRASSTDAAGKPDSAGAETPPAARPTDAYGLAPPDDPALPF